MIDKMMRRAWVSPWPAAAYVVIVAPAAWPNRHGALAYVALAATAGGVARFIRLGRERWGK